MIDVRVNVDSKKVEEALGEVLAKKAKLVMARAANRSVISGKSVIKKETAKKYVVLQRDVEAIMKVTRAMSKNPSVKFTFTDDHKNLFYWSKRGRSLVTPAVPISYDGAGNPAPKVYAAHVMRSNAAKELGGKRKPFVQIAAKSGNMALFRRVSEHSRKIEGVAGPALPQIISNKEVMEKFQAASGETLQKRLLHEIDYELSKCKGV